MHNFATFDIEKVTSSMVKIGVKLYHGSKNMGGTVRNKLYCFVLVQMVGHVRQWEPIKTSIASRMLFSVSFG